MEVENTSSSRTGSTTAATTVTAAAYLVWEDLTVVLNSNIGKGPTRRLLQGLTGYAEPGRILAIMGPSGSGKSTLLDALAGRLSRNGIMTGNVLLNGKKMRSDHRIAYVTQEDVLLGTLTIRETITYSAHLRLPSSMSKQDMMDLIEGTIVEMGLHDCADRVIGNWHLRGISGGEKKRLSIAVEILTRPPLLFLDEPTSGLDSAAAFFVIQILRNIARDGRTVVSSIHQPSSEVFSQFDDLYLLSGGESIYFGDAKLAVRFFAEAGFPCPSRRNPSDHFLRCINTDFDAVTATLKGSQVFRGGNYQSSDPLMNLSTAYIKELLIERYKCSDYSAVARKRVQEMLLVKKHAAMQSTGSNASWWKQVYTLTKRSFINMSRDIGYYWLRIIIYIMVSLCVGTIFFDVGTSYNAIYARGACGAFITGFMTFMSIGGFPSFIEEMKVFNRERLNGYYGVASFVLSNFFSSFPFLVAVSSISGTITYQMVKFHTGFSHFAYAILVIFSSIAVIESCMMVVASLVPNYMMGIVTGAGVLGIMMMTAGFFRFLPDLPKPVWRYPISYISYGSWALQGQYKNDMMGLEFDPEFPGQPKLKGEVIMQTVLGIKLDHSKWWDLCAVLSILVCYRLIFSFSPSPAPLDCNSSLCNSFPLSLGLSLSRFLSIGCFRLSLSVSLSLSRLQVLPLSRLSSLDRSTARSPSLSAVFSSLDRLQLQGRLLAASSPSLSAVFSRSIDCNFKAGCWLQVLPLSRLSSLLSIDCNFKAGCCCVELLKKRLKYPDRTGPDRIGPSIKGLGPVSVRKLLDRTVPVRSSG